MHIQICEVVNFTRQYTFQVKEIAGDLDLSREEVLYFVGWLRSLPQETRESMKQSREAAEDAMAERKQLLREKEPDNPADKLTFQGDLLLQLRHRRGQLQRP